MTPRHEDWDAVGDAVESLALKLKLHVEQVADQAGDSVKTAVDELGDAIDRSFDALRAATQDEALKEDVREVATQLRDAVANTLSELRS